MTLSGASIDFGVERPQKEEPVVFDKSAHEEDGKRAFVGYEGAEGDLSPSTTEMTSRNAENSDDFTSNNKEQESNNIINDKHSNSGDVNPPGESSSASSATPELNNSHHAVAASPSSCSMSNNNNVSTSSVEQWEVVGRAIFQGIANLLTTVNKVVTLQGTAPTVQGGGRDMTAIMSPSKSVTLNNNHMRTPGMRRSGAESPTSFLSPRRALMSRHHQALLSHMKEKSENVSNFVRKSVPPYLKGLRRESMMIMVSLGPLVIVLALPILLAFVVLLCAALPVLCFIPLLVVAPRVFRLSRGGGLSNTNNITSTGSAAVGGDESSPAVTDIIQTYCDVKATTEPMGNNTDGSGAAAPPTHNSKPTGDQPLVKGSSENITTEAATSPRSVQDKTTTTTAMSMEEEDLFSKRPFTNTLAHFKIKLDNEVPPSSYQIEGGGVPVLSSYRNVRQGGLSMRQLILAVATLLIGGFVIMLFTIPFAFVFPLLVAAAIPLFFVCPLALVLSAPMLITSTVVTSILLLIGYYADHNQDYAVDHQHPHHRIMRDVATGGNRTCNIGTTTGPPVVTTEPAHHTYPLPSSKSINSVNQPSPLTEVVAPSS